MQKYLVSVWIAKALPGAYVITEETKCNFSDARLAAICNAFFDTGP